MLNNHLQLVESRCNTFSSARNQITKAKALKVSKTSKSTSSISAKVKCWSGRKEEVIEEKEASSKLNTHRSRLSEARIELNNRGLKVDEAVNILNTNKNVKGAKIEIYK